MHVRVSRVRELQVSHVTSASERVPHMQRCRRDFEQILLLHTIGKTAFFGKQFIQLFQRGFSYIRHSIFF
jgi:hypothetical protein